MNQGKLEYAVLTTVVYYDVLGKYPLTALEIYKYLINPSKVSSSPEKVTFGQLTDVLDKSRYLKARLQKKSGFYFLSNRKNPIKERIKRQKIADRKWKKARRVVKWFQIVPYLRMAAVSGSLAIGNTRKQSDLDLIILAEYGRIWTVRFLLNGFLQLIGQRRHGQSIEDKICLNQYVTDKYPEIVIQNLSNAHFCAHLVPLLGLDQFQKFRIANQWTKEYLPFYSFSQIDHLKTIKPSKMFCNISRFLEFVLNTKVGDQLEKSFRKWQKNKVLKKTNPEYISFSIDELKQKMNQAHLCLSDETLILHYPISRNLEVQDGYGQKIQEYV